MTSLFYLAILWIIWCFFHSWFIWTPVTLKIQSQLGKHKAWFRIIYNIFSLITLLPVLLYWQSFDAGMVYEWNGWLLIVKYVLWGIASVYIIGGIWSYDLAEFMGIKQLDQSETDSSTESFSYRGIHRWVRHPWYAAVILLVWAKDMDYADLVTAVILTNHVMVGTYLEEKKMVAAFGQSYLNYRKEVPAYFPWNRIF